jgi:hypothetical protein
MIVAGMSLIGTRILEERGEYTNYGTTTTATSSPLCSNILGDDIFWPAVKDYLSTYAKKTVETSDFRKKLEEHSGLNLTKYFEQW